MKTYHTHTLANGLRLIHEPSLSEVVYCGYVVMAGTRHEEEEESGMAHFIEHMSFKGTARRKAVHIANGLERVGGDLNAFTNKQETVYYATVLRPDFARAVDLLTDIVFCSTYPQHEIDKEREVVCDEIDSYKDSPAEIIFDEFESLIFPGHPLGRDILGQADRLRQYVTADLRRFTDRYYRPSNVVFYVYGNVPFERVVALVEKAHAALPFGPAAPACCPSAVLSPAPVSQTGVHVRRRDTHQAHVLVGAPAYGGRDDRRYALLMLNNILGGPGMNSRLNMSLRERAGLVYSVDSYLSTYPDAGFWNAYFGCDIADVDRCLRLLRKELARLSDVQLSPRQLAVAKQQLRGQLGISCDAFEGYALALGKTFAHYGVHRDIDRTIAGIEAVTPGQLQAVAAEVYAPDRLTTLIYRPEA